MSSPSRSRRNSTAARRPRPSTAHPGLAPSAPPHAGARPHPGMPRRSSVAQPAPGDPTPRHVAPDEGPSSTRPTAGETDGVPPTGGTPRRSVPKQPGTGTERTGVNAVATSPLRPRGAAPHGLSRMAGEDGHEARLSVARARALAEQRAVPSKLDEVVRAHEYDDRGEVISKSGNYAVRGQSGALNPPATGPVPRTEGPVVNVKFKVHEADGAKGTRSPRGGPLRLKSGRSTTPNARVKTTTIGASTRGAAGPGGGRLGAAGAGGPSHREGQRDGRGRENGRAGGAETDARKAAVVSGSPGDRVGRPQSARPPASSPGSGGFTKFGASEATGGSVRPQSARTTAGVPVHHETPRPRDRGQVPPPPRASRASAPAPQDTWIGRRRRRRQWWPTSRRSRAR